LDKDGEQKTVSGDNGRAVELLYPFYLDTEMSMAFAAAISGGVALQSEDLERQGHESEALRNIQGNLRAFNLLDIGGRRGSSKSETGETESRFIREHTEASIFIALHDELKRTGQIKQLSIDDLSPGEIVSVTLGPAVSPLRRAVDQVIRLFEVMAPIMGVDLTSEDEPVSRQVRRQNEREAAKTGADEESGPDLKQMLVMFRALKEDLDQSGMLDVVVRREGEPSVLLTLDKRFASETVLELLHTSEFTVVGKVTEIWRSEDEGVNLYRRSVTSLVPALTQTVAWGMMGLLAALATGADSDSIRASAFKAAGVEDDPTDDNNAEGNEVLFGDIGALLPGLNGPAVQILPLAICA
jgi:hypothetical protein